MELYNFDYSQTGGKQTHKYKGKSYLVRTGSRGGRYILHKKEKIYLSKIWKKHLKEKLIMYLYTI